MEERNLRQTDVLRLAQPYCTENLKLTKSDLSQFVNGKVIPGQWKLDILSKALDVSPAWLMGHDVPRQRKKNDPAPAPADDDDLWTLRESLRDDPNRRMLFHLAKNATKKDVDAAVALIDALKATNPDFYDGDDPA